MSRLATRHAPLSSHLGSTLVLGAFGLFSVYVFISRGINSLILRPLILFALVTVLGIAVNGNRLRALFTDRLFWLLTVFVVYSGALVLIADDSYRWASQFVRIMGGYSLFIAIRLWVQDGSALRRIARGSMYLAALVGALLLAIWIVGAGEGGTPTGNLLASAPGELAIDNSLAISLLPVGVSLAAISRRSAERLAMYAAILLTLGGLLVSAWRAALLAAVVTILLTFVVLQLRLHQPPRPARPWIQLSLATLATVAILAMGLASSVPLLERVSASSEAVDPSTGRVNLWTTAVRIFEEKPLFGVGPGNFREHYLRMAPDAVEYQLFGHTYTSYLVSGDLHLFGIHPHNLTLNLLAEYGIVGFALFVIPLGFALRRSWRLGRRSGGSADRTDQVLAIAVATGIIGVTIIGQFSVAGYEYAPAFWVFFAMSSALREAAVQRCTETSGQSPKPEQGQSLKSNQPAVKHHG